MQICSKPTLLCFVHIPVGLWSRSASLRCSAPPAATMETRSSTCFSRAHSSGGCVVSAMILEALQENLCSIKIWSNSTGPLLAEGKGVKQVASSTARTTPNCSHHSKKETRNGPACQHHILTKPIFSIARGSLAIRGSPADMASLGGVACHSEGRLMQRI